MVTAQRKIATLEEAQSLSEQRRVPSRPAIRIAGTLHLIGLNVMVISIAAHIVQLIAVSRHLKQPNWLSSFNRFTPYSLWAGLLLVFAGIVVRDRRWGRTSSSN